MAQTQTQTLSTLAASTVLQPLDYLLIAVVFLVVLIIWALVGRGRP